MTFRKTVIPIQVKATKQSDNHVEYRNGYMFEAMFSTGQIFDVAVYKDEAKDALHVTRWIVTDINTGYAICDGKTRKDAVKRFQETCCSKLERMVLSNVHEYDYENWYEYTSRKFSEMLKAVQND